MTQKDPDSLSYPSDDWKSTRIENAAPDLFDPEQPRLGRRESEPHSMEVTYLYDVLTTNFPEGRALWDLHHYFIPSKGALKGTRMDLQLDISFFKELDVPVALPSYDAIMHEGKIPDICINVLSKSTWRADLSEHVDACRDLSVPVYVVFSPYNIASKRYAPPFLRAYVLQEDGTYKEEELRSITVEEGGSIDDSKVIDISDNLPFRLGLMQLKKQFLGGAPLFRLILLDPLKKLILPTRREKEVNEVKKEAEQAKKETEQSKKVLEVKEKNIKEKDNIIADLKKQLETKK